MRQKVLIFFSFFLLIILLIGLNAASYTQQEKGKESESAPNRSSFNSGPTGTRAFYQTLAETGRKVVRWQEPPDALLEKNAPRTFVVIGSLRRDFTDEETRKLLQWVSRGGKLVVIDRAPPEELLKTTADWKLSVSAEDSPLFGNADTTDQKQLTEQIKAVKPVQPTIYTQKVIAAQPSIYSSSIKFEPLSDEEIAKKAKVLQSAATNAPPPPPMAMPKSEPPTAAANSSTANNSAGNSSGNQKFRDVFANSKIANQKDDFITVGTDKNAAAPPATENYPPAFVAPVAHLGVNSKNLLVDVPYDAGEIVYLSDPFIVANNGVNMVDNAQLGINIVSAGDGVIAFDEYHQGFGANQNRLLEYFAGTPVVAIFLQIALLAGLLFLSQSRRFARAVPEPEPNRLSKLEYVAAMAELQQRTKSFDLAMENIYNDFRRRAARYLGADNYTVSTAALARMIAERTGFDRAEIAETLQSCEDIKHGEPTNKKKVLRLTTRLRELEAKLGLQRKSKR